MFYYISFLRPPPLVASLTHTDPILVTPQICNDLRTEYLHDPIDIYYAWSLHEPRPTTPVITKPTKLTSWRPDSAYKEIRVPRPPPLNTCKDPDGPSWRLVLTCGTTPDEHVIALGDTDTTGKSPFAVMSLPVRFPPRVVHGPANKRAVKNVKQEMIVRSYALRVPQHDRPIVFDITEKTSFDLDKVNLPLPHFALVMPETPLTGQVQKVWDSGIGLSSWLVQLFAGGGVEASGTLLDLRDSLFSADARHILELGAGTGMVAVTLAVLRSILDLSDHPGSIVTTDLPSAIPILQGNLDSNLSLVTGCIPKAAVLDWEHEEFPFPVQAQLEVGLDVIVMADVTYNTASFSALIGTLSRLVELCKQKRNGRPPRILMGYKERHPDERSLWDRVRDVGIHFGQIARVDGAGGNPVEVWLG